MLLEISVQVVQIRAIELLTTLQSWRGFTGREAERGNAVNTVSIAGGELGKDKAWRRKHDVFAHLMG